MAEKRKRWRWVIKSDDASEERQRQVEEDADQRRFVVRVRQDASNELHARVDQALSGLSDAQLQTLAERLVQKRYVQETRPRPLSKQATGEEPRPPEEPVSRLNGGVAVDVQRGDGPVVPLGGSEPVVKGRRVRMTDVVFDQPAWTGSEYR